MPEMLCCNLDFSCFAGSQPSNGCVCGDVLPRCTQLISGSLLITDLETHRELHSISWAAYHHDVVANRLVELCAVDVRFY